ncbi:MULTISPECIES: HAAS signaling domain-containing protein [unclassified Streptomyces]|uniref:HAAS signaling domain-containing protein n=1 Tax=unclassified Streptomyces TaxID=2593676 RepID=UPI0037FDBA3A
MVAYLDAVAREAADLVPERRTALLADLTERLQMALAERPARSDAEVEAVLDRLGDPRTVVAAARDGETIAPPPVTWHSLAPLILLPLGGLLLAVTPLLGGIVMIASVVLLWGAPHWGRRDKIIGTAAALLVPVGVAFVGLAFAATGGLTEPVLITLVAAIALVAAAASLYLFRAGRRMPV